MVGPEKANTVVAGLAQKAASCTGAHNCAADGSARNSIKELLALSTVTSPNWEAQVSNTTLCNPISGADVLGPYSPPP
jgi:hypothetical protein